MHTFRTEIEWQRDRECRLSTAANPDLAVAAPPAFGGPEGVWSPEELLVGSVGGCLLSTFLYFAYRFELAFGSYSSTSTGSVEKTSQGLRFTSVDVQIAVSVPDEEALGKAASLRLKEKLEKYCPVSASLNCPVHIELTVTPERPEDGAGGGSPQ